MLQQKVGFKYDAWGNRIAKRVDSNGDGTWDTTQWYSYDGWNPAKGTPLGNENFDVWADLDGSTALTTRYLRADLVDQLMARIDSGTAYWELGDRLGSTGHIIDNNGTVKDAITYDGWGNATHSNSAFAGRYLYTGREWETEAALQYHRRRYYDPATGRWISQDPLGFGAGDSNLYRYVQNSHTNFSDPSGLGTLDSMNLSGPAGGTPTYSTLPFIPGVSNPGMTVTLPGLLGNSPAPAWQGLGSSSWPSLPGLGAGSILWPALPSYPSAGGPAYSTLPYIPGVSNPGTWTTLPSAGNSPAPVWQALGSASWPSLPALGGGASSMLWPALPSHASAGGPVYTTLPYIPGVSNPGTWTTLPGAGNSPAPVWQALGSASWPSLPALGGGASSMLWPALPSHASAGGSAYATLPYIPGVSNPGTLTTLLGLPGNSAAPGWQATGSAVSWPSLPGLGGGSAMLWPALPSHPAVGGPAYSTLPFIPGVSNPGTSTTLPWLPGNSAAPVWQATGSALNGNVTALPFVPGAGTGSLTVLPFVPGPSSSAVTPLALVNAPAGSSPSLLGFPDAPGQGSLITHVVSQPGSGPPAKIVPFSQLGGPQAGLAPMPMPPGLSPGMGPGANPEDMMAQAGMMQGMADSMVFVTPFTPSGGVSNDWFAKFANFSAGMGDAVSLGLTKKIRQWGNFDAVNYNSGFYTAGQVTGTAVGIGLGFGNPCALGSGFSAGLRFINGVQAVGGSINAGQNIAKGNYGGAALDLFGVGMNGFQMFRPCFLAGTPLLTPTGDKPIEQFRPGDWILSAPEDDPDGPVQPRQVEEVFVRVSPIMNLHVGGRIIGTTAEHPFFVQGRAWIPTAMLEIGDLLRSHDGQWLTVEGIADSGQVQTVYNLRVAEYHTYFVAASAWGFSVWSHNSYAVHTTSNANASSIASSGVRPGSWVQPFPATAEGLANMETVLHTGGAFTGVSNPQTQFILNIRNIPIAATDARGGAQLAARVEPSRIIDRILDPGNPDEIRRILETLGRMIR